MPREPDMISVESRLSRAESEIESLAKSIQSLVRGVERIDKSVEDGFAKVNDRITNAQRPQWTVMLGAASVLLTIVGGVGAIVLSQQARDVMRVEMGTNELLKVVNTTTNAVAGNMMRIETNSNNIHELDVRLQREVQLVNAITKAEIESTDKRLQDEIRRGAEERRSQIGELKEFAKTIGDRSITSFERHARNEARLDALEKK